MNIEVFADIWCPFTHVGLRAIDDERRRLGRSDIGLIVRAWPLELVNGVPMPADKAVRNVAVLRGQVAPDMFADFDGEHFPTSTLPALALVARAYRMDVQTGERASFAVRDALFEHGQDISDQTVLEALAGQLGLEPPDEDDRRAVTADWEEGKRRGVRGSPHVYCGATDMFCPTLEISNTPETGLCVRRNTARLKALIAECFARSA